MKNNLLTLAKCLQVALLPVLVLAICIPDTGSAQTVHQAAGTWNITVSGSYQFELQLRQSGQTIEGTMRRTNGTEPIDAVSGTVGTDDSVTFTRTRAPNEWRQTYTGNIKAQGGTLHMNGNWAHNGNPQGTWNAEHTGGIGLGGAGIRQSSVTAIIDKKCIPRDAQFTVPAGQTATNFRFSGLSSGTHCTTGGRVANPAWGISSGSDTRTGNVFYYNQNDNGTVHEVTNGMPGRLVDLVLGPGQYAVHVDGGIDAHVLVTFDLIAAIPGGGGATGGGGVGGKPTPPVKKSQPPSSVNIVGNWIFSMEYQGSYYAHDMFITSQNNDGSIKGNGGYPAGKPHVFDWTITTGSVTGGNLNFYFNYTRGVAGTTHVFGTISLNGSMSGSWTDNVNGERKGTWTARKSGN